jgi:putative restriction endonuclease
MKKGQRLWSRDELILAVNLYCKLPFGRLHSRNPAIIHLAELIERTPNSVAFKLVNFASLDPSLQARGIKGASNASNMDRAIWSEFYNKWETLAFESEQLLARFEGTTVEQLNHIPEIEIPKEGKSRDRVVKVRVNQNFFRKTVLASYENICCITGIEQPELLIAGHIKPWSVDEKNRLNPRNGIAINALHDKAFETGMITITPDFKIKISNVLKSKSNSKVIQDYFLQYDNQPIIMPKRFIPDPEFLVYHNQECFRW